MGPEQPVIANICPEIAFTVRDVMESAQTHKNVWEE